MNEPETDSVRAMLVLSVGTASADQKALRYAHGALHERRLGQEVHATLHRGYLLIDVSPRTGEHPHVALRSVGEAVAGSVYARAGRRPWVVLGELPEGGGVEGTGRELRDAVGMASSIWEAPGVLTPDDVVLARALLGNEPDLPRLARVLEPLTAHSPLRRVDLVAALEAYLSEGMSASGAARVLDVNRTTLEYRVRRAEEILGRSLSRLQDRVLIEVALIARRLTRDARGDMTQAPDDAARV